MKKVFRIIAIVLIVIVLFIVLLLVWLSKRPAVPDNYTEKVPTGGEIESKYLAMGEHDVNYFESTAMMDFQKFEIYYPSDMADMKNPLPAVVFVNGTGTPGTKYPTLQKHLASWGFITIATEEDYAWNGFSAEMCVRFLDRINSYEGQINNEDNIFKGRVDLDNIGITGHSQGGIGVINAVTDQHHADIYKAAVILSSTESDMAKALMWDSDSSKIHTDTLMIASTGKTDASICPLESMQKTYENITADVAKIMARRNDCDHGEMLYYADGYVTAWFMWHLQQDADASKAFVGSDAEIMKNPLYQDQQSNISE